MSRDHVLSFVDRVVQTASESECQRACDSELQFVCRSYSFTGTLVILQTLLLIIIGMA